MIKDVIEECRKRTLETFPERQLYLRSGGEVKYYNLSTRRQVMAASALAMVGVWSIATMFNLFVGHNPLRPASKSIKVVEAKYQRLLADAQAKEANARLMLDQQQASFSNATRQFQEKHETIAQMLAATGRDAGPEPITAVEYAASRVQMSPNVRDTTPRQARTSVIQTADLRTGMDVDRTWRTLDTTQNDILVSAEAETLERIARNRAIIAATDVEVDTVLEASPTGQGGLYIDLETGIRGDSAPDDEIGFGSRIASIKARVAEADALDDALTSVPLGHPVADEHYRTSGYGIRKDPFTKRPTFHEGVDFGARRNAKIVATANGVVTHVGRRGGYGKVVEIDHGHGFVTRYAHLEKTHVKRGDRVKKGEHIGGMGSTGRSTATHLHYEVHFQDRVFDPDKFLKAGDYVQ